MSQEQHSQPQQEKLLTEMKNRFVLFPIQYKSIWDMYKIAESAFWTTSEIDVSTDKSDWENLKEEEQFFIKRVLAFFAGSDGIVNENLALRFMNEVKVPEAKSFYGFQIAMENIHCVERDTEVLTKHGYVRIGTVEDKNIQVWNGDRYSHVLVKKTHDAAPAFEVTTSNGMRLTCTPNHEWIIEDHDDRVKTMDLKPGMVLKPFEYPVIEFTYDDEIFSNIQKHGDLCGVQHASNTYNPMEFNCRAHLFVPSNFGIPSKCAWLSGLFKHAVVSDQNTNIIELPHWDQQFVKHVQLLLTTLGCFSSTTNATTLTFDIWQAKKLVQHGVQFPPHLTLFIDADIRCPYDVPRITVVDVKDLHTTMPMFCFEEEFNHTGVFNGILTGQSEMYSLLIDTYIKDPEEKATLLDAIHTIPCIEKKAKWAIKWIEDDKSSFAKRLVAFACVEGIFFSGAFCSIFWLKERGVMPGLCLSNEFISRDESLHTEFAILLYSMLEEKLDTQTINDIITEAVMIEDEFINESIPCSMLGMNRDLMSQYIKFVADRLVVQLGYEKIYNVTNPFHFMDRIALSSKTNFFEHRVSEYARRNDNKPHFSIADDDF